MRNLLRYLARPGVFIALVGVLVIIGAGVLWGGMSMHPVTAAAAGDQDASGQGSGQVDDINPAITRALLSMANLAFEEPFDTYLEDAVKQADFALVQAMLRSNMPLEEAVVEQTELRSSDAGPYHFQRIRITVGKDSRPFITGLEESLRAWAENAHIARSEGKRAGGELWTVSVGGIETHELFLVPFPVSLPGTDDGPGRVLRRRASGEVARMVIVIDDIGEDMSAARTLSGLPFPVTFAIWPRSTHAHRAAETANAAGLEIIVHQPTEPIKYPEMNPGPGALFTSLSDAEIEARVKDSLLRVPNAVGMNNHMGSKFTRDRRAVAAMVRPLRKRGFFVLDSLTHPGSLLYAEAMRQGIPALKRDVFLDSVPGKENALKQLYKAERIALVSGRAVAIGHPLPGTLAALKEWEARRDTHIELVRLSDLLFQP